MTNRWTHVMAAAAMVWAVCAYSAVTSRAQGADAAQGAPASPASVWSGVYSEAQATRGAASATKACASCHGPDLMGGEAGPTLVGLEFLGNWNQQSLGDLLDRVHTTMPADAPGSLSVQESADIVARILQLNKFPAGQKELPSDMNMLGQIKITAQPPAK